MPSLGRLVVVDDDEQIVNMLLQLFTRAGYQVITMVDSAQAFSKIKRIKPDLAILDVMMPEVDGLTICNMIKKERELADTKVIILSAKTYEADKARALELGADMYVEKPFEATEFLEQVQSLLAKRIKVKFWGTRGSIPTPGGNTLKYGGNTSCVEVRLPDDQLLIFDAGTGIRSLGNDLLKKGKRVKASIFISHPHWDHIQGLPFFVPAYLPGNEFVIYGAEQPDIHLSEIISAQMESVYFPVALKSMAASITFTRLSEGRYELKEARAILDTIFCNHPGFTLAYRLTQGQRKLVYMTDNELDSSSASQKAKFIDFVNGVDLLIHDAQYTEQEYATKRGWGHTTWPTALEVALAGQVERLALFHHDPDHSDEEIEAIVQQCKSRVNELGSSLEVLAAQEGLEIHL